MFLRKFLDKMANLDDKSFVNTEDFYWLFICIYPGCTNVDSEYPPEASAALRSKQVFHTLEGSWDHVLFRHLREGFDCSFCRTFWSSVTELKEHIREIHPKVPCVERACGQPMLSEANWEEAERFFNTYIEKRPYPVGNSEVLGPSFPPGEFPHEIFQFLTMDGNSAPVCESNSASTTNCSNVNAVCADVRQLSERSATGFESQIDASRDSQFPSTSTAVNGLTEQLIAKDLRRLSRISPTSLDLESGAYEVSRSVISGVEVGRLGGLVCESVWNTGRGDQELAEQLTREFNDENLAAFQQVLEDGLESKRLALAMYRNRGRVSQNSEIQIEVPPDSDLDSRDMQFALENQELALMRIEYDRARSDHNLPRAEQSAETVSQQQSDSAGNDGFHALPRGRSQRARDRRRSQRWDRSHRPTEQDLQRDRAWATLPINPEEVYDRINGFRDVDVASVYGSSDEAEFYDPANADGSTNERPSGEDFSYPNLDMVNGTVSDSGPRAALVYHTL